MTPGERVRQARVRAGLTQEELAEMADCTRNTIQNLEGNRTRSRRTVRAVAAVLATTPEELGFRFRTPIKGRKLTALQRTLINELLDLSPAEQARVLEVLAGLRAKRKENGR